MKSSSAIFRYLFRSYLLNLVLMVIGLWALIYLFDTVELLRRASKKDDIPLSFVLQLGLLKLPEVGFLVLPFAVLFSGMYTFWQFNRRRELVSLCAAGFSIWQTLAPVLFAAAMAGFFSIMVVNPVGALLVSRFETLENTHLSNRKNYAALFEDGLWLRQNYEDGYSILHAGSVKMPEWRLKDVMVVFFDENDGFIRRLDAQDAVLKDQAWLFNGAVANNQAGRAESLPFVSLPTDLTIEEIEESFSSPETLSFWKLPGFIKTLEATGFSSIRLRVHFQALLSQPLLYMAMILLAAAVAIRPPRFQRVLPLMVGGISIGFFVFFMSNFLQALGTSHQIPPALAAWSPAVILFFLGTTYLFYAEEG